VRRRRRLSTASPLGLAGRAGGWARGSTGAGNFWGLQTCPKDWARLPGTIEEKVAPTASSTNILPPNQAVASENIVLDRIRKQLSNEHLKAMLAELIRPLEASATLQTIQKGIEASVSESLRIHVAETLQSFEHRMEELAQQSVERWRLALAGALNSLARTLGEQFRLQAASDTNAGQHSSVE
jgi:hypothetical protein